MTAARELAKCAFGVGVLGAVPVAAMLVADEAERNRCGIGCILEKNEGGVVYVKRIMPGGGKNDTALTEGDIILKVDDHKIEKSTTIQEVSSYIRGMEGSHVTLTVLHSGRIKPATVRIVRRRLPGSKAEMLGALWQLSGPVSSEQANPRKDPVETLRALHARGNLSDAEYQASLKRLREQVPVSNEKDRDPFSELRRNFQKAGALADSLTDDLQILFGIHRSQAVRSAHGSSTQSVGSIPPKELNRTGRITVVKRGSRMVEGGFRQDDENLLPNFRSKVNYIPGSI